MEKPPGSPLLQQQEPAARSPVCFLAPLNLAFGSEATESTGKDMDSGHLHSLQRDAAQEPGLSDAKSNAGIPTDVTNVELSLCTSCAADNHLKRKRYDLNFITLESPQRNSGNTVVLEEDLNSEDLDKPQEPGASSPIPFVAPLHMAVCSEASQSAGKPQEPGASSPVPFVASIHMAVCSESLQSAGKDADSANLHSPWRVAAQEPGPSDPNLNAGSPSNMHNSEQSLRSSCAAGNLQNHKGHDLNIIYLEAPQIDSDDTVLEEAVLEEANHSEDFDKESCDVEFIDRAQQKTVSAAVQEILRSISLLNNEERDELTLKMCTSIQDHSAQPQKGILDINAFEKLTHGMQNDEINAFGKQIQTLLRKRSRELKKKSKRIEYGKGFMIRKKPFLRLVREVAEAQKCSLQFSAEAIEALQLYAEAFVVEILTLSARLTHHAKRVQLMPADMNLALDICKANYKPIIPPSLIRCKNALGILLVGLPKSGKTSILQKMNLGDIGSSSADDLIMRVRFRNITFTKWTLDGGHSVSVPKSIGEKQVDVLMYVVDSARSEVFDTARSVLYSILDQEYFRRSLLLVCSHKCDLHDAVSESEIVTHLGLNQLEQRIWHIQCTSTITGDGLYEALDWIVSHLL